MIKSIQDAEKDGSTNTAAAARVNEGASTTDEQDEATLAAMGLEAVLKREFTLWSCFSFALSISGLYPSIMVTFVHPLIAGGAACIVWSWLIAGAGALALALSSAEIASAYPSSGAMYFTLRFLAPERHIPIVSWICGWLSLVGQIAGISSSEYSASQMLLATVSIGSNFTYSPTQAHVFAVAAALTVLHALVNSMSTAWLNHLTGTYAVVHITALVAVCITLLVVTGDKHSAEYVFTDVEPHSGWPTGFSFFFGFLSAAWTMTNAGATGHLAEETKDPHRAVPRAIVFATVFTYVGGWLFNIVLVFCLGSPTELLASPVGQPVAQLFYNSMGRTGSILCMVIAFLIMNFVCVSAMMAGSRMAWAFSRDEMLPLSRVWYRTWSQTGTPLAAVWLCAALCVLIGAIGLGSYTAVAAVFSICAICHNIAYCIPIGYKLLYGRFTRGPWHMGIASLPVDLFSLVWSAFVSVVLIIPPMRPVTAENMNYASGIILFFLAIAVGYWFIQGRHDYVGPRISQPAAPDIPTRISTRRSTQEPESGVPRRLSFPTR